MNRRVDEERGNRDEMVIATKFTNAYQAYKGYDKIIQANFTDYIDLLWLHWWDYTTSIPELMHALNDLIVSGKVIYLGVSDTPAWIVSKANEYARSHNLRPLVAYQGQWSAASRDFEREIIPMCQAKGMALCPWGALGGGNFKTAAQRDATSKGEGPQVPALESQIKLSEVLESIAERKGSIITGIALAYVMHKVPYVFPICGGRKVEHLKGNIEALSVHLTREDLDEIESAVPFDLGFPHNFALTPSGPAKSGQGDWARRLVVGWHGGTD